MALTDKRIQGLRSRNTSGKDYHDEKVKGLMLRVYASGRKRWFVRYTAKTGQRRRYPLGDYPALALGSHIERTGARGQALRILGQAAEGKDPQGDRLAQRGDTKVRELFKAWAEGHAAKKVTGDDMVRVLAGNPKGRGKRPSGKRRAKGAIPGSWWSRPARSITTPEVTRLLDTIAVDRPYQANKVRAYLSSLFAYGVPRGMVDVNPVAGTTLPHSPEEREGDPLKPEQIRKLWAVLTRQHPIIRSYYRVRLLTLQRGKQVRLMRWRDVERTANGDIGSWWKAPPSTTKTKRPNRVYLNTLARRELERVKRITGDGEYVFASPRKEGQPLGRLQKASSRIRDAANLPHEWAREFRRTGRTWLAETGKVSPDTCERVLGHAMKGVRPAYDDYEYTREKRAALNLWDGYISEVLLQRKPEPARVVDIGSRS